MMLLFDKVSPSNKIILFLSLSCEACTTLERELPNIQGVEFVKYWVSPSRTSGKLLLRPLKLSLDGVPTLVDAEAIPIIPAAYDPNTQEIVYGIDGIFSYLESCGLIEDTP